MARQSKSQPIHPGEILKEEFLKPLGMSASTVATKLKVPVNRITQVINGHRAITADTAIRLATLFGTTSAFWMNLQSHYELELAEQKEGRAIRRSVSPIDGKKDGNRLVA